MVNLKINGIAVSVPEGSTILQAAKLANVRIPTLCYLKEIQCIGSCRMCLVEATGARGLVAACVYPVSEGMEVRTNTPKVRKSRKTSLELILSTHKKKCLSCVRSMNCELQKLALEYNAEEDKFGTDHDIKPIDDLSPSVVRDNSKCIMCTRCVAACEKQTIGAIGPKNRGYAKTIGSPFDVSLAHTPCVNCGQCVVACPVGALYEKSNVADVWGAIVDPTKKVVFFTAPSVRATLGEAFGLPVGTNVEGKMVTAIKQLGDVECFNMDTTADLTIMEEANELLMRVKSGGTTPMFTSCCPGWIKFCEHYYPEYLPNLSTCKSPQEMFSAVLKTYYCQREGIDPKNLYVVSVIPCTAKKFEVTREELGGYTDSAITTRELAKMIKEAGVDFANLPDTPYDDPFGLASGAGAIFGATGGVMEAALRTAAKALGDKDEPIVFNEVRGTQGLKEATFTLGGVTVSVAIANGLANARKIIESIKSGEKNYTFVEVMACPGGCINGGGQPYVHDEVRNSVDLKTLRAQALYDYDSDSKVRCSHENATVTKLYEEFFGEPNSHKAHELLHTTYTARPKY
ncbi:MAG: NADH-dependent [FeFe] hydrogenase, group A6 [Clostridiales bacterium]|nr:NADH-dependent [FeFe] hydrogenase, group A6 [Clostridiales bacterium]